MKSSNEPGKSLSVEPPASRYCAFISYRHGGKDGQVAEWLGNAIERYRIPRRVREEYGLPTKVGRLFRDEEELPTSSSLSEQIEEALKASRFMVIICSPRIQQSKWCRREIEIFERLRGRGHMIAALVEGDPSLLGEALDPFPPEIRYRRPVIQAMPADEAMVEDEPIAADFRAGVGFLHRHARRRALLRIIAGLVGCNFDDLYDRDRRRGRLQASVITAISVVLMTVLAIFATLTLQAHRQTAAELRKEIEATRAAHESSRLAVAAKQDTSKQTELRQWAAYIDSIKRVGEFWNANNIGDARRILDEQIPIPGEPRADLRGIEWYRWDCKLRYAIGESLETPDLQMWGGTPVRCVVLSPDDKFLAACWIESSRQKPDAAVVLWDLRTRKVVHIFRIRGNYGQFDPPGFDSNLAFSPDGKLLAACSCAGSGTAMNYHAAGATGSIRVWNVETGAERFAISNDPRIGGRAITFSPDGKSIIAGGYASGWLAWNVFEGQQNEPVVQEPLEDFYKVHSQTPVIELSFDRWQKKYLISSTPGLPPSNYAWPKKFDEPPPLEMGGYKFDGRTINYVYDFGGHPFSLSFIDDGPDSRMEVITINKTDRNYQVEASVHAIGKDGVTSIFLPSSNWGQLVAGYFDGVVREYSLTGEKNKPIAEFCGMQGSVNSVTIDEKFCVGGSPRGVHLWDLNPPEKPTSARDATKSRWPTHRDSSNVNGIALQFDSPYGNFTAYWDRGKRLLTVYRAGNNDPVVVVPTNHGQPIGVEYSPNERYVAISFSTQYVGIQALTGKGLDSIRGEICKGLIYDLQTGKEVLAIRSEDQVVYISSFSDDGNLCAASIDGIGGRVYRIDTGTFDTQFPKCDGVSRISPSGRYIGAVMGTSYGVYDRNRRMWIIRDQPNLETCAFDSDEKHVILTGGANAQLYELPSGNVLPTVLEGLHEQSGNNRIKFSEDQHRLFFSHHDGVNVYDIETGKYLAGMDCSGIERDPERLESVLIGQIKSE